jgi:transcription elongation factor
MLAIQKRNKYFSRVMTMPNGVEAVVYFELIERNGQVVAKAIYAEAIISQAEIIALPTISISSHIAPVKSFFTSFISPYFKDFSFVMSQPTRAPSF